MMPRARLRQHRVSPPQPACPTVRMLTVGCSPLRLCRNSGGDPGDADLIFADPPPAVMARRATSDSMKPNAPFVR